MKIHWIAGVASLALLSGCGAANGAGNAVAEAQSQQTAPTATGTPLAPGAAVMPEGMIDLTKAEGGVAGCYDANEASGRTARVAQRLGAHAGTEEEKSPGDEPATASGTGWIVGSWIDQAGDCAGDIGISYSGDGNYSTGNATGRWARRSR